MTWVGWRLQRTETLIALGILALLAALLVPTGIQMANAYHQSDLTDCLSIAPSPSCAQSLGAFQQRFESLLHVADWLTLIPGLIGVLLAAPFILDLENGTYRLAWTQSITRERWLLGKLAPALITAVICGAALSLLFTWSRAPNIHINGSLDNGNYDSTGVVVVGYTLFALAVAVALGAIWRRVAASLTVAFVAYFASRIFVDYVLRNHLIAPLTATYKGAQQPSFLYNAHILSMSATGNGRPIMKGGGGFLGGHTQAATPIANNVIFHVTYQPQSHFWPLQLAETGLFLGVAALLILFAARYTLRRTS